MVDVVEPDVGDVVDVVVERWVGGGGGAGLSTSASLTSSAAERPDVELLGVDGLPGRHDPLAVVAALVTDDRPGDLGDPGVPDLLGQLVERGVQGLSRGQAGDVGRRAQEWISPTDEVQVAVDHPVARGGARDDLGDESGRRPELVEHSRGGEDLHVGRRDELLGGVRGEQEPTPLADRQAGGRLGAARQCGRRGRRQGGVEVLRGHGAGDPPGHPPHRQHGRGPRRRCRRSGGRLALAARGARGTGDRPRSRRHQEGRPDPSRRPPTRAHPGEATPPAGPRRCTPRGGFGWTDRRESVG